jgi:hypothetical protein
LARLARTPAHDDRGRSVIAALCRDKPQSLARIGAAANSNKHGSRGVRLSDITDGAGDAMRNAGAYFADLATPSIRLGVTGLARAGKTVFITALANNLIAGGRLPFFAPVAAGRVQRAYLEPQPDDTVPRFAYEENLAALHADPPEWPQSTRSVSQLRVTIEHRPSRYLRRKLRPGKLHVDIVDYPGEWLLDLPLLDTTYRDWSAAALGLARNRANEPAAAAWLRIADALDPLGPADEQRAITGSALFKAYLLASRGEGNALSTQAPGRFLLPGELEGTPALTFMPLALPDAAGAPRGSLWAMMERRYGAYVHGVVRPFWRDHFCRLDRQIVLIDALAALNAGPTAVADLERALSAILAAFRTGANTYASAVFARRIDKILIAASKADHLHHDSHDRLEAIVGAIAENAMRRAEHAGATVKPLAIAAVRSTREAERRTGNQSLSCIVGVPLPGERLGSETFDGKREVAVFPGDLPADPKAAMGAGGGSPIVAGDLRFLRFRPVRVVNGVGSATEPLPNIRLDRALDFLLGDHLA